MRSILMSCASLTLALLAVGCASSSDNRLPPAAESLLKSATSIELLALDPEHVNMKETPPPPEQVFHDYAILGRAALSDAAERERVVELVLRGIRESDGRVAGCFNPRHGLRVEHDGKTLDLVICYECLSMSLHGDVLGPDGFASALTAESVEPDVTRLFERAGLKIAGR